MILCEFCMDHRYSPLIMAMKYSVSLPLGFIPWFAMSTFDWMLPLLSFLLSSDFHQLQCLANWYVRRHNDAQKFLTIAPTFMQKKYFSDQRISAEGSPPAFVVSFSAVLPGSPWSMLLPLSSISSCCPLTASFGCLVPWNKIRISL